MPAANSSHPRFGHNPQARPDLPTLPYLPSGLNYSYLPEPVKNRSSFSKTMAGKKMRAVSYGVPPEYSSHGEILF